MLLSLVDLNTNLQTKSVPWKEPIPRKDEAISLTHSTWGAELKRTLVRVVDVSWTFDDTHGVKVELFVR